MTTKRESSKNFEYEAKENKIDWYSIINVLRNKFRWRPSNTTSNKMMSIMNENLFIKRLRRKKEK